MNGKMGFSESHKIFFKEIRYFFWYLISSFLPISQTVTFID